MVRIGSGAYVCHQHLGEALVAGEEAGFRGAVACGNAPGAGTGLLYSVAVRASPIRAGWPSLLAGGFS